VFRVPPAPPLSAASLAFWAAAFLPRGAAAAEYTLVEKEVLELDTPGSTPYLSPLADFTGDGVLDFVSGLWLFEGAGDGTFTPRELFTIPVAVTGAGDVDGDGLPDILAVSPWFTRPNLGGRDGNQRLELRLNRGNGSVFVLEQSFPHSWDGPDPVVFDEPFLTDWATLADLDGNGLADIVASGVIYHEIDVVPFRKRITLISWRFSPSLADYAGFEHSAAIDPGSGQGDHSIGELLAADLNGDGFVDLAVPLPQDTDQGFVTVLLNDGGAGLSAPRLYPTLPASYHEPYPSERAVSAADVDVDGDLDLVVGHSYSVFSVLLNSGDGSFAEGLPFTPIRGRGRQAVAEDLNGDGRSDALVHENWMLTLHMSFLEPGEPIRFSIIDRRDVGGRPLGELMKQMRAGDLNGDGLVDVIVNGDECELHAAPCTVVVLLGTLGGEFLRGDVEPDGTRNITDAVTLLSYLFLDGEAPACADVADTNDDGGVTLTDAVYLLNYLFLGGPRLPAPFPEAGQDPTVDTVVCVP
jgi:hypothetical protein